MPGIGPCELGEGGIVPMSPTGLDLLFYFFHLFIKFFKENHSVVLSKSGGIHE